MQLSLGRRGCIALSTVMSTGVLAAAALAGPAAASAPRSVVDGSEAAASSADGPCVQASSVWIRSRPGITRTVRIPALGSAYGTVLAVFGGPRGSHRGTACADDAPVGRLVLRALLPTEARSTTTIEDVETGVVSGRLLVQGTSRCATPSELQLTVTASQQVGLDVARGEGFFGGVCGPVTSLWTVVVEGRTGWAFQPGTAVVTLRGFAGDAFDSVPVGPQTGTFPVNGRPDVRVAGLGH